jgi:hypothetical protein
MLFSLPLSALKIGTISGQQLKLLQTHFISRILAITPLGQLLSPGKILIGTIGQVLRI